MNNNNILLPHQTSIVYLCFYSQIKLLLTRLCYLIPYSSPVHLLETNLSSFFLMTHISSFTDIHLYYSYYLINITICNYNTSNAIITHHSYQNFCDTLLLTTSHTSSALIFSTIQHVYTTWYAMHRSYFLHHRQLQILFLHHQSSLVIVLIVKYYNIHYIYYNILLVQLRSYLGVSRGPTSKI